MPIKSKWILTLGILAMFPGAAMAKNPFTLPGLTKSAPATAAAAQGNQEIANAIAAQLRQQRLVGKDIDIKFENGVATLSGMILDANQKATAQQVTAAVPGVQRVQNNLGLLNPPASQAIQQTAFEAPVRRSPEVQNAAYQASAGAPVASPIQQTAGQQGSSAKASNQRVANNIAQALKQSGVSGYDIEISYKNGVAGLSGTVSSGEQVRRVSQVVSQVPGVQSVDNQMKVSPVAQTAFQADPQAAGGDPAQPGMVIPMPGGPMPGGPMGPGGYPAMGGYPQMGGYPPSPMMGGPVMGHPGPGPVSPVYNQPNLPGHSWPTYAAYPNSAAVTYPTQYSASAFPYIGPFYPYPQVPLGWRSSTLEWDDGQWQLTFSPKTDRWWWFMNPKNWD